MFSFAPVHARAAGLPHPDERACRPVVWWSLAFLIVAALVVRLALFTGMAHGDDGIYATQAIAHASRGDWPPAQAHWQTRLGMTLPVALSIRAFGMHPLAFVLWPLAASLLRILVCYRMARDFVEPRTAYLAAIFQAAFPLDLIYGTHLFPDMAVGLFSTLSLWFWLRALQGDRASDYVAAGGFFAAGYLCRETVFLDGPIYLALWAWAGRWRRPRLPWVALIPALAFAAETGLYAVTAGSPFYRWEGIRRQLENTRSVALVEGSRAGGDFLTDPLIMAFASHEFALYMGAGLIASLCAFRKWPTLRPLALWLVVGFAWLYYGTTSPTRWVRLDREPRYAAVLVAPCAILVARSLAALGRWPRLAIAAALVVTGVFAADLDQGGSILTPHRAFVESRYSRDAVLEPYDYFLARWVMGLPRGPSFDCASDCGHEGTIKHLAALPGLRLRPAARARYFVFSPFYRPDLQKQMEAEGWSEVDRISGQVRPARAAVGRLLALIPSQAARAERIAHPPSLVVLAAASPSPPREALGGRIEVPSQ